MPIPYSLQFLEGWQAPAPLVQRAGQGLSPRMAAALQCEGSLTRHLQESWSLPVTVRLEDQSMADGWEENPLLWNGRHRMAEAGSVVLRNAWLSVGGQVVAFAHSQVTLAGLAAPLREAIQRGEQPLGTLFLEQRQTVTRSALELALVRAPQLVREAGLTPGAPLWCRRSLLGVGPEPRARILELFLGSW